MPSMRALVLGPLLALGIGVAGLTATAAAHPAPTCVPASIDNSALQADAVTVSPLPGSRDASPRTQISFLGVSVRNLTVQSVVGSRTGTHSGRLAAYSQGDGASFVPSQPFAEGERVSVCRSFRMPWTGLPSNRPALAFSTGGSGAGTAYASWNGATGFVSWRLLAGGTSSTKTLHPLLRVTRSGFETALAVPGGTIGPYLAVQALDAAGHPISTSAAVREAALG